MDRLLPSGEPPSADVVGSKSKFTPEEDRRLLYLVEHSKMKLTWKEISFFMVTRSPRQCRERYKNYLSKNVNHEEWTEEEDQMIMKLYKEQGKKWNYIASLLKGRTSNAVRNRWFILAKKFNLEKFDEKSQILTAKDLRKQNDNTNEHNTETTDNNNNAQGIDIIETVVGSMLRPEKMDLFDPDEYSNIFI